MPRGHGNGEVILKTHCQYYKWPSRSCAHKKTAALRLSLLALCVLFYNCFFDFSRPWDLRRSSVTRMRYLRSLAKCLAHVSASIVLKEEDGDRGCLQHHRWVSANPNYPTMVFVVRLTPTFLTACTMASLS